MSADGNIQTLELVWENECSQDDKYKELCSPPFTVNGLKFQVFSYPNGSHSLGMYPGDWMSLYINLTDQHEMSEKVSLTLSLLNQSNEKIFEKSHYQVPMPLPSLWSASDGFPKYVKKSFVMDPVNKIIKNNTFKISCKVFFAGSSPHIENEVVEKSFCRLREFDKFETLLINSSFSDVTITIEEKDIYAHKCLLTSGSPVFKAMFEHDMKEKSTSSVKIEDIKYRVMYELIRFIYTGKVIEIEKIVCDLLYAAEKYSIDGLKVLCKDTMLKEVNENNALKYLVVADLNSLSDAVEELCKWISLRLEHFFEKAEFKSFGETNPKLFYEILQKKFKK